MILSLVGNSDFGSNSAFADVLRIPAEFHGIEMFPKPALISEFRSGIGIPDF